MVFRGGARVISGEEDGAVLGQPGEYDEILGLLVVVQPSNIYDEIKYISCYIDIMLDIELYRACANTLQ